MKMPVQCKRCGKPLTPIGICPVCSVKSAPAFARKATRFGQYEIEDSLGQRGGMGVVFKAFSPQTQRHVALKMLRNEILLSSEAVERFRNEIRALAALNHPNILPIYDAGTVEGQPFFAMRWVGGGSLVDQMSKYTLAGNQATGQASACRKTAEFMANIAFGVHHAHKNGILHRDLKPGNILLDEEGRPYVADFGIAKFLDDAQLPAMTQCDIGSPPYMPPEPARKASPSWDIWSMGVILYELITGQLPFQAEDKVALQAKIRNEEPARPSRINPLVSRDLETICLKCLQKEPSRRYLTANDLADDLLRCAHGEPIQARASGTIEQWCYFWRRRPLKAVVAIGAIGICVILVLWRSQVIETRHSASVSSLRKGGELLDQKKSAEGLAWLAKSMREDPANTGASTRAANALFQRDYLIPATGLLAHDRKINVLAFSPDGSVLATGTSGLEARLWDARTGRAISPPLKHSRLVSTLAFSPDGRWLVTGSADRLARIWNATNGLPYGVPFEHKDRVDFASFCSEDNRLLTVCHDGAVQLWDIAAHKTIGNPIDHHAPVLKACGEASRGRVVTVSQDGMIEAWSAASNSTVILSQEEASSPACVTLSPKSRFCVKVLEDGSVRLFDLAADQPIDCDWKFPRAVEADALVDQLAIGSSDGSVHIVNLTTGRTLTNTDHLGHAVSTLAYATDRPLLAVGYDDGLVRMLDGQSGQDVVEQISHSAGVSALVLDGENKLLAVGYEDGNARIYNLRTRRLPQTLVQQKGSILALAVSRDAQRILTGGADGSVRLWDTREGVLIRELPHHRSDVMDAAFSLDGRRMATASFDQTAQVYEIGTNPPAPPTFLIHTNVVRRVAFCPTKPLLATAAYDGYVRLWELPTGRLIDFRQHGTRIHGLAFSDSGDKLASGSGKTVKIWRLFEKLEPLREFEEQSEVWDVAFSPDGRLIASACFDGVVRVREANSGAIQSEIRQEGSVFGVAFSRDGCCLLTVSTAKTARIWDTRTGLPLTDPFAQSSELVAGRFGADGQCVVTATADGTVRGWPFASHVSTQTPSWWPGYVESFACKRADGMGAIHDNLPQPFEYWRSRRDFKAESPEAALASWLENRAHGSQKTPLNKTTPN